ncbi:MAG: lipid-A-disaccharide synthase [Pseudomonadota bacterium]
MIPLAERKRVMIIAGEASGDLHGSKLVRAMRERDEGLFFCGIGGPALKEAGVKIEVEASTLSVVGITEVFSKIPNLFKGMALTKRILRNTRPDLLILIDFPDFNLHLATAAKRLNIPVLYYIAPQIWAWRPRRVKKIGELVDHVAVILPFEEDYYKSCRIPVTFVGHPLLDIDRMPSNAAFKKPFDTVPVIGLLPGSRDREIARHLPVMFDAAGRLLKRLKNVKFIISIAPSVKRQFVDGILRNVAHPPPFEIEAGDVRKVFEKSDLVVASSGTVTLESAIFGTPMVIIYKVSPLSHLLGKALIKVRHIGLVNLIAGREIVPELLQHDASPGRIADTVFSMLSDASGLENIRQELLDTVATLGGPGASRRVADIAMNMLL